jgi:hypothetical protein
MVIWFVGEEKYTQPAWQSHTGTPIFPERKLSEYTSMLVTRPQEK